MAGYHIGSEGKGGITMQKIFYYMAIVINSLAVLALLFFLITQARSHEYLLFFLFLLPPVLSLVALVDIAGPEERKLAKPVRLGKLKKELSELQ